VPVPGRPETRTLLRQRRSQLALLLILEAFTLGLHDHGWIENQNFVFVRRFLDGLILEDRLMST
jgi:hypothetical protein